MTHTAMNADETMVTQQRWANLNEVEAPLVAVLVDAREIVHD
ncbi:MAG: hypothetical protein R3E79_23895 [Caldilineaceae bacterium]